MKLIFKALKDFGTVNAIGRHTKPESDRDVESALEDCERDLFETLYVYSNEVWIGQHDGGEYVKAVLTEDGTISKLEYYDLYTSEMTADGNVYMMNSGSGYPAKVKGKTFNTGDQFTGSPSISSDDWRVLNEAYDADVSLCEECGFAHDTDGGYDHGWVITEDGGFYCKTCVQVEDLLVEVRRPDDLFKAKDVSDCAMTGFKEYKTLFCDRSGFGSRGERALTKEQAIEQVRDLLKRNKKTLYAGITDIGQFQVHVTLFKRANGGAK